MTIWSSLTCSGFTITRDLLPSGLDGIRLLHAVEGGGDGLQLLQPLDVVFRDSHAAHRAGQRKWRPPPAPDRPRWSGAPHRCDGPDGVDDVIPLLVLPGELHAQSHMGCPSSLVVHGLAQVMEETCPLGGLDVGTQLRRHHTGDVADFDGVLQHVLDRSWCGSKGRPSIFTSSGCRFRTPHSKVARSPSALMVASTSRRAFSTISSM